MLFSPLVTLLACGDFVETPLLSAELSNRDLQLTDLGDRLSTLEGTVTAQAATIAQQAAVIDAQQSTIDAQAQAITTLEATVDDAASGVGARVGVLETSVGELATAVTDLDTAFTDHEAAIDELYDGLAGVGARVGVLETTDSATATSLVGLTTSAASVATAITTLQADVADLQASSGSGGGGVWSDEGSGSGNCARANVTTTSAGPLYVFATVEASYSFSGGCTSGGYLGAPNLCGASSYTAIPNYYASLSGSVSVSAENAAGTWSDTSSTAVSRSTSLTPASSAYAYSAYSGRLSTSDTWTVPLQTVLNIPAAGSYIVDLDVTGISGACTLVVLQP